MPARLDQAPVTDVFQQWVAEMRLGNFEAAWRLCDVVLAERRAISCSHLPRHQQYVWDGTPLDDRHVLIRCFHGLGDTIQFIRFAPQIKAIARDVTVEAQPELLSLLRTAKGIDRIVVPEEATDARFDVAIESMETIHALRSSLKTLPREVPYLHVTAARIERGPGLNVGLVWRAGPWDERRSICFAQLRPLLAVQGVSFHVLQRGDALAEWPGHGALASGCDDVMQAARVMKALDVVITIDSMPAHLAGALGVPVWILLHADADWRWMNERTDSPWYPTARLFRQKRPGDWSAVIDHVAEALASLATAY